jgi:PEP-CTERM motif
MTSRSLRRYLPAAACGVLLAAGAGRAEASELSWTDWTAGTSGLTSGSVIGTLPGIGVSYSGPFAYFDGDGTGPTAEDFSLAPAADGIVIFGGPGMGTNTITFNAPVVDPVFAIWAMGFGHSPGQFLFSSPYSFLSGDSAHGGALIQFSGTFTSISWTNPVKDYYFFTVGAASTTPGNPVAPGLPGIVLPGGPGAPGIVVPGGPGGVVPTPVIQSAPEPATLILLGAGLTAIAVRQRRLQRRKQ